MSDSYSVKAILSAKDSGFSSTLKSALSNTESLASKIKNGFSFGVFAGAGAQAFSMITSGAKDLVSEIDSSNAAWKTFEGNMKILKKSDEYIGETKKELQEFAQQTVYSSSDMASTFAQLEAVGTKNTAKLVKGFGGLAAAAENPQQAMKTLSQQATQMAAKPKVAWEDFKLMLEQSPAGMAAVAQAMGMSTSEMVTAVQDGKIATSDFLDTIATVGTEAEYGFADMATEAKTVGQAMDGLKETVGNKLTPAFDFLSQKAIGAVNLIAEKLDSVDAQDLLGKVTEGWETMVKYATIVKDSFSGVGKEVGEAFTSLRSSISKVIGAFGSGGEPIDVFRSAMENVADAVVKVSNFIEENSDTIAKAIPCVIGLFVAFKGYKVLKTAVPFLGLFTKGIAKLAGKGIGAIAGKLFGISKAQKKVGEASDITSGQMLTAAKSFTLMAAAVLLISAGFALMAYSAISLSEAGGGAIGVMFGLLGALLVLGIGMGVFLGTLSKTPAKMQAAATAMLMMGAAVLLISAGFSLLAFSAISLANAGGAAIAVMFGMVASIALLAVGAALLGTALTAGAAGFIAFGAALLMVGAGFALIGAGAMLAAISLQLITAVLPVLTMYATSGAEALMTLGLGLSSFALGALLAGAAALVLGAGLLLCGVAVIAMGAGLLLMGSGAILAAVALQMISTILPVVAQYGMDGAVAILALGGALVVFGAGALLTATAVLVLSAAFLVTSVAVLVLSAAVLVLCAGVLVLSAALLVISVSALVAAAALAVVTLLLPSLVENGAAGAVAITTLGGALLVFAGGAAAVGVALLLLSASMITLGVSSAGAAIGVAAFGVAMTASAVGVAAMAVALKAVSSKMKTISKNAKETEESLKSMKKSVKTVEEGLEALGSKAKSAMKKLTSAFDDTVNKAKKAGKEVGTGFTQGMQGGLASAPSQALLIVNQVTSALRSGGSMAYSAGAYISIGFANGMLSQLAVIQSAASRMAAAADKAVRAKAKIHSPSRVATKLGNYWGEGYVNGILGNVKEAWNAAKNLVSIPSVATPQLAYAYSGELSSEYEYSRNNRYTFDVTVPLDGREIARVTVDYTEEELNRKQRRDSRKHGKV